MPVLSDKTARRLKRAQSGLAVTTGVTLFSAMPFLTERFGPHFLPDPTVLDRVAQAPWVVAVLMAVVVFALLMSMPSQGRVYGTLRWVAPVFYMMIFYFGLTMAVPMAWTIVAGRPAAMVVTVTGPLKASPPSCPDAVLLQGMPIVFDRLCGLPPEAAQFLTPGDRLILLGRRSRLGVFYTDARLLPVGTEV